MGSAGSGRAISPGSQGRDVSYRMAVLHWLLDNTREEKVVNVRWLWVPLVGASVFLALPGNETIGGVLGDVVGHFFSAALVAVVPVVGYRLIFKDIGEKEITYIFAASWAYLVISQIFKL